MKKVQESQNSANKLMKKWEKKKKKCKLYYNLLRSIEFYRGPRTDMSLSFNIIITVSSISRTETYSTSRINVPKNGPFYPLSLIDFSPSYPSLPFGRFWRREIFRSEGYLRVLLPYDAF